MRLKAKKILWDREIPISVAANHCGVSREFLSMVLNGYKHPSLKVRQGLSKFLRLPQKELFQPINETG
jgi:hypothetical protein